MSTANASGWQAGGQAGYNWQRDAFVYGIETDLSGVALKHDASVNPNTVGSTSASLSDKMDWYGTLRGRIGLASGAWLLYGTGGFAYGGTRLSSGLNADFGGGSTPGSLNSQFSALRTGWVAGGGIEYRLRPSFSVGFAYQYVDLGAANFSSSASIPSGAGSVDLTQNANVRAAFQVFAASLNWQFAPADTKSPWRGFYAGVHGGGATGSTSGANYSAFCNTCFVAISDARLKRDVTMLARMDDGLGIYRYRYVWSDRFYIGVMAQEVALLYPGAVVRSVFDDYLRVDYGKLGLTLQSE